MNKRGGNRNQSQGQYRNSRGGGQAQGRVNQGRRYDYDDRQGYSGTRQQQPARRQGGGGIQQKFRNQKYQDQDDYYYQQPYQPQKSYDQGYSQGRNQGGSSGGYLYDSRPINFIDRGGQGQGKNQYPQQISSGGIQSRLRDQQEQQPRRRTLGRRIGGVQQRSKRIGKDVRPNRGTDIRTPAHITKNRANNNRLQHNPRQVNGTGSLNRPQRTLGNKRKPIRPKKAQSGIRLPTEQDLKHLQVKAELSKLSDPPRAYVEKLQPSQSMQLYNSNSGRLTIGARFSKIQDATRGPSQVAEGGSNQKQGPQGGKTLRFNNGGNQGQQQHYGGGRGGQGGYQR